MPQCFVMQPFDGGTFDNRYADVFAPAIRAAGLEPYRVDQDPKVSIPIQDIENGIRDAQICLADITLDNPNVWFELGFAIAMGKEVVLVCSDQRKTHFPFDVQHRSIIRYKTDAPRDFQSLQHSITKKIEALLRKVETLSAAADVSNLKQIEGLDQNEVVTLAAVGENVDTSNEVAAVYQIRRDMEKAGFTRIAATMALHTLNNKGLLKEGRYHDQDGQYAGYSLTKAGWDWILANKHLFHMRTQIKTPPALKDFEDNDIPF